MKNSTLITLLCFLCTMVCYKTNAQDAVATEDLEWSQQWVHAFSKEGRKAWKPEFTLRCDGGIYATGWAATGGVRIDEKRSLGLLMGKGHLYIDHMPGEIHNIRTALTFRRYFHLGKRKIISFYSDLYAGAAITYKVEGKYRTNKETGEVIEMIEDDKGDVWPLIGWQPGIRIRFVKNVHLFLGPTISTDCYGLHIGFGF